MALNNYHDISVGGSDFGSGFQYEFFCTHCDRRWKSPFKPYRMGQFTGLLNRFTFLFTDLVKVGRTSGNMSDMGSRGARESALAEAMVQARTLYVECGHCGKAVCDSCFDQDGNICAGCKDEAADRAGVQQRRQADEGHGGGGQMACANCGQAHQGGRFCAECGYDMASTHKGCPVCGTMTSRQSRFCTDCGHGF